VHLLLDMRLYGRRIYHQLWLSAQGCI